MHELIRHFISLRPSWLLIDSDWMMTRQASELIRCCAKVVAIGRLKWIAGSDYIEQTFDNYFSECGAAGFAYFFFRIRAGTADRGAAVLVMCRCQLVAKF
jgi:hypothetical protein